MDKKVVIKYVVIVVVLVLVTAGLTYAYFTVGVNNSSAQENEIISGNLDIEFQTSQWINNENMLLINEATEKETKAEKALFTVKNIGNVKAAYDIYLTDVVVSNNLKASTDFKWELVITDGTTNTNTTYSGNFTGVSDGRLKLTTNPKNINVSNNTDSCVLKIWLANDPENSQLGLLNGSSK